MKRTERVGAIIKILSDRPETSFSLGYFCDRFGAAKSTISEDVSIAGKALSENDLGRIVTTPGAAGGVRYVPFVSDDQAAEIQRELCEKLSDPSRITGGGFLYTSDIMFSPEMTCKMAGIFARRFAAAGADSIVTIETKGVPLALETARLMGLPLTVVRRETKVSEGPAVSINYFSGTANKMSKMSVAKKSVDPGSKAILIDDFMRAGGSLKGIIQLLQEFDVEVSGIGVAVTAADIPNKKVDGCVSLVYLEEVNESENRISVSPNSRIFSKVTL